MFRLTGIYPALVTPFSADDRLDTGALHRVIEYNLKKGVDGFYVCGSTGESLLMSMNERKALLEETIAAVAGRANVVAHIGCFHTQDSIELARHAMEAGACAISSLPPFYYKFTLNELTAYYMDIVNAVPLPMIIYNAPELTGISFDTDKLRSVFASESVVGIKFTSYDLYQMQRIIVSYPDKFVINGHDEIYLPGLVAGSRCAIGSTFNFMAEQFIAIRRLFLSGDIASAAAIQDRVNAVIDVLMRMGVFRGVKGMLQVLGLQCGECRKPFAPLTHEEYTLLENTLRGLEDGTAVPC